VLVIASESRLDLNALSRAIARLDEPVDDLAALSAALLAGHAGAWAAYLAPVD
jgi:hypothetical protein